MNYSDMLFEAIKNKELNALLKGEKEYKLESSQYVPSNEPTDVSKVLSDVIYKAYEIDPSVKEKVEEELLAMLDQTHYDVYVVIQYIMSQLFKEKHGLSPFKMDMSNILPKLKEELIMRREGIKRGLKYPDGSVTLFAWDDIDRFSWICNNEYGFRLF